MNSSIILIAYYADKWLPACIESLKKASQEHMHLVLVDNAGNTIIDELDLSGFDAEIIKTPGPLGFAEANNYALVHAKRLEEAIVFLNQDTTSHEGWVDQCLECLARDASIGAVSPLILNYDATAWDPSFLDCVDEKQLPEPGGGVADQSVAWFFARHAPAPCLIVRKDVLRETGPFDPVFGSYYEDYDLCLRISRKGYQIAYCENARVNHFSGSATTTRERELKRMRQIIRNRTIYRLRDSSLPRPISYIKTLGFEMPRRLFRGVWGTASSQPPSVVLSAYSDLLRLATRLVSKRVDKKVWSSYLEEIGWPHHIEGFSVTTE